MSKDQNSVVMLLVIIIAVAAGSAIFSVGMRADSSDMLPGGELETGPDDARQFVPDQSAAEGVSAIPARVSHENGTFTITARVNKPTPCHAIATDIARTQQGNTRIATLDITILRPSNGEQVCAQVITPVEFTKTFNAPRGTLIRAHVNGQAVELVGGDFAQ